MTVEFDPQPPKVLLVDDMESNLYAAAGLMRKFGLEVDCLTSGNDAIDRINAGAPRYRAIFMDHMMPDPDGIETTKQIRALDSEYAKKIPVIALTGNTETASERLYYTNGFQDILYKPIEIGQLGAIIMKWISEDAAGNAQTSTEMLPNNSEITIEIPGVDSRSGLARYNGDIDIYLSVMRSYANDAPSRLAKLRSATAETLPECLVTVHGLKGAAASICAENATAAAQLEKIARNGDLAMFLENLGPFINDSERLSADIKAWLCEYDEKNEKPRLHAPDRKTLEKLLQSCQAYEMSGIDEAMDELEGASYDTQTELITWLREKLDVMEIDEVVAQLKEKLN